MTPSANPTTTYTAFSLIFNVSFVSRDNPYRLSLTISTLTFATQWTNSADDKMIFSPPCPPPPLPPPHFRKYALTFNANCLYERKCQSLFFPGKKIKMSSADFFRHSQRFGGTREHAHLFSENTDPRLWEGLIFYPFVCE